MQRYTPIWICFFFLFPSIIRLPAQGIVFSTEYPRQFKIPYTPVDPTFRKNGNEILRELAKDVLREPWFVILNIKFDLGILIRQRYPNTQLQIFFKNPVVFGDIRYRRFSIADVLIPTRMNFDLKWALKSDTSNFTSASFKDIAVGVRDSLVLSATVAPFDANTDTLMIGEVALYYDENALNAFNARIQLINDYYASVALLDTLERMANDIDINDASALPVLYMKVTEFNKVVDRIDSRSFSERLLKDGFDPKGLTDKFLLFYKFSRSITFTLQDQLNKTGAIPWSGNLDPLAGYFTGRMLSYVLQSHIMDNIQGDIYQDYLDRYYDRYAFANEAEVLGQILGKMFPDAKPDTLVSFVSGKLFSSYCRRARQLINQDQYASAFVLMENARRLASAGSSPSAEGDAVLTDAAHGIFNSYVGIALSCVRSGKYLMADEYLAKAEGYRHLHADLIRSDSLYKAVFSELFFLRNRDCDQLLSARNFGEALNCYQAIERSYDKQNLINIEAALRVKKEQAKTGLFFSLASRTSMALIHNQQDSALAFYDQAELLQKELGGNPEIFLTLDSLSIPIGKIRYRQYLNDGIQALEQRHFLYALTQLNNAKRLLEHLGIAPDNEYNSLYRTAIKQVLLIQLSSSQKQIWLNQFDSVRANMHRIKTIGSQFGLMQDPDFIAALDRYSGKIQEQHCRNFYDSIGLMLIRADRNIALKNFLNASQILRQVLALSALRKDCMFPETPVRDTLAKYQRAAEYQQRLMDVNSNLIVGSYHTALQILSENELFYQTWQLNRFGFPQIPMYDFIKERANPYFTEKVIGYYYGKAEFREAFRYLQLMKFQGFPERSISSTMDQLARRMASEDFRTKWQEVPESILDGYTGNDSWYGVFRLAYLNEWKRLMKATHPILK